MKNQQTDTQNPNAKKAVGQGEINQQGKEGGALRNDKDRADQGEGGQGRGQTQGGQGQGAGHGQQGRN